MENITVRKAGNKDIPQLIKLYSKIPEIQVLIGQEYDKEYFLSHIKSKDKALVVADINGIIIGGFNAEFDPISRQSYLINIVVDKKYRGLGISRMLFREMERLSRLHKQKIIFALVYEWNKRMRKVIKKNKYSPSDKLIIYSKKI